MFIKILPLLFFWSSLSWCLPPPLPPHSLFPSLSPHLSQAFLSSLSSSSILFDLYSRVSFSLSSFSNWTYSLKLLSVQWKQRCARRWTLRGMLEIVQDSICSEKVGPFPKTETILKKENLYSTKLQQIRYWCNSAGVYQTQASVHLLVGKFLIHLSLS